MKSLLRKLTWWAERRRRERELREELQFHLDEEAAERSAGGLGEDEARSAARRDLGNVTRVTEDRECAVRDPVGARCCWPGYGPAWRASRIGPMIALRHE